MVFRLIGGSFILDEIHSSQHTTKDVVLDSSSHQFCVLCAAEAVSSGRLLGSSKLEVLVHDLSKVKKGELGRLAPKSFHFFFFFFPRSFLCREWFFQLPMLFVSLKP
jgi:hypothetical protein